MVKKLKYSEGVCIVQFTATSYPACSTTHAILCNVVMWLPWRTCGERRMEWENGQDLKMAHAC